MTFSAVKTAQENYLKIMQGLIARSVFLHGTYSRHNTIIVHLYETLKRQRFLEQLLLTSSTAQGRKEVVDDTDNGGDSDVDDDSKSSDDDRDDDNKNSDDDRDDTVMDKNSRLLSTASHINDMISKSSDEHGLVSFLIIHVANRKRDVLLYIGQQLITPIGNGVITQLRPHDCMVTCQLPFGLLYAHISRVVGWCRVICDDYIDMAGFTLDTASVEWLCRYCEANLIHSYTLSKQDHASIQQLIAANAFDETVVVNHHHHPLPPHTTTTTSTAFAGGGGSVGGVTKADGEDDVFNHQDEMMVDELSEETDLEAETNSNDTKAPPSQVDGPVASSSSSSSSSTDHCDPISSDTNKAMITSDDSNRSLVSEQLQQHHQSVVFPLPIVAVTGEIPSRQRVLSIMEQQIHDNYRYYHAYHCTSYTDDDDNYDYEYGEDDDDDDDEHDDVYDDDQYTVHLTAKSC